MNKLRFAILGVLLLAACGDPPVKPPEGVGIINWSQVNTNGRSNIRIALLADTNDGSLLVVYEIVGRHNDDEEQPYLQKNSFHVVVTSVDGSVIEDQVKAMVTPSIPKQEDFVRACAHSPFRGIAKYRITYEGGKRYLTKGINELGEENFEKFEIPATFRVQVIYSPLPKEYLGQVQVINYLNDQVKSNWIECK
jgi:hypothetical protein